MPTQPQDKFTETLARLDQTVQAMVELTAKTVEQRMLTRRSLDGRTAVVEGAPPEVLAEFDKLEQRLREQLGVLERTVSGEPAAAPDAATRTYWRDLIDRVLALPVEQRLARLQELAARVPKQDYPAFAAVLGDLAAAGTINRELAELLAKTAFEATATPDERLAEQRRSELAFVRVRIDGALALMRRALADPNASFLAVTLPSGKRLNIQYSLPPEQPRDLVGERLAEIAQRTGSKG